MHARQKGGPEAVNAMCLGFYEQSQNGYRVIGYEGNTVLFHSNIFLDAKTGLFVSYTQRPPYCLCRLRYQLSFSDISTSQRHAGQPKFQLFALGI